jgi:cytidyltransferase-like protein
MGAKKRRVLVSGCFDVLHSGHVEFLQRAAEFGELHVSVGSDATVMQLKGRRPVIPEEERVFIVRAIRGVHSAFVASGSLPIDFQPDMERIRPDIIIVNADGVSQEKRDLCSRLGVEIRVLERVPAAGLAALSTTSLRSVDLLPYRVEMCGGWSDLPENSALAGGAVVTVSLEPHFEYAAGGMAGSTRKKAAQIWGGILPGGDPIQLAHQLFCCDNPPGTAMVSGPQDAIGICVPGVCLLEYDGQWWPSAISRDESEASARFIEENVRLLRLPKRNLDYNPLGVTRFHEAGVRRLADSARLCWQAILSRDAALLARAFNECRESQNEMMPFMFQPVAPEIEQLLARCGNVKLSGAGGGGLAVFACTDREPNWIVPRVRR